MNTLSQLDRRLAGAAAMHSMGRLNDAMKEYVAVLEEDPKHVGALLHYATLMSEVGRPKIAIEAYGRILALNPRSVAAMVSLGNVFWSIEDHAAARRYYEAALAIDPACADAHQGMANVFSELRDNDAALEHGRKGYAGRPHYKLPYRGNGQSPTVLVLYSTLGGNIPLTETIDNRLFQHVALIPEFFDPAAELPPHDVAFNAIGDADLCAQALRLAAKLLKKTAAPVLNPPKKVEQTGRAANAQRLSGIAGLVTPSIREFQREALEGDNVAALLAEQGFRFPLLLRAEGFHAGQHLAKLDSIEALAPAMAAMPGLDFAVVEFMDARGADGNIRKYRVMSIDGLLYPLHAATSKNWKIHYFSADMAANASNRAEDEAFLADMPKALGPKAMAALGQIQAALGLDYAGIDFSLNAAGEVLLFEANATMVIARPPAGRQWDYRRAAVQKVLDAVTAMLNARAASYAHASAAKKGAAAKEAPSAAPSELDQRLAKASALHGLGRRDEAKLEYVAILKQDSNHVGALAQYAYLQHEAGRDNDAIEVYSRILSLEPRNIAAHVNLATVLSGRENYAAARSLFEAALAIDPECVQAHQGLATVLSDLRETAGIAEHRKKGFAGRPFYKLAYLGSGRPLNVLVFNTLARANTPLDATIDNKVFQHIKLNVEFFDPADVLPPHDLVWNAIGDADLSGEALDLARALLKKTKAPILNTPDKIAVTGRAENVRRLAGIEGLVVPRTASYAREALSGPGVGALLDSAGFRFPLLLRAEGFQGGKHFMKLDTLAALGPALAAMPGRDFAVIEFMDSRRADGKICKYRVMMIDGRLHPLHAAISPEWKIHYFSADMKENAVHRAEDEAFLNDMPKALGDKAVAALKRVQAAQGLDYAGIDFGLNAAGEVLFYESNATMTIARPAVGALWDYRRAPVQKVVDAVNTMLRSRIRTKP